MSNRNEPIVKFESHQRVYSYKGTNKSDQNCGLHSSSSSSLEQIGDNFNSGQVIRNAKDSYSESSRISSDNQTQNFIRAEFNKHQAKKQENFKLFPKAINKKGDGKRNQNIFNQDTAKQQNTKKHVYETTFFQVDIQDEIKNYSKPQKPIKKHWHRNPSNPQKQPHNPQPVHRYSQLEQIESAIMRTLKQKQNQIFLLQNQVIALNEQKLFNFKVNQQLQKQLTILKQKTSQIEKIKYSSLQSIEWKPINVEQMKLAMQNQRLKEQLQKLQKEEANLKLVQQQMTDEQVVLRESLQNAFRTRRQCMKGLTKHNDKQQKLKQKNHFKGANTQVFRQSITKNITPKQKTLSYSKTSKRTSNNTKTIIQNQKIISTASNNKNQLNSMQQKQLLLKLVQDFNELKNKVDQSLVIKTKNKSKTKSSMSTETKRKRRVVFNNC